MTTEIGTIRDEVIKLIDHLPKEATWNDVCELVSLRAAVERGRIESDADLGTDVNEVRADFGLDPL